MTNGGLALGALCFLWGHSVLWTLQCSVLPLATGQGKLIWKQNMSLFQSCILGPMSLWVYYFNCVHLLVSWTLLKSVFIICRLINLATEASIHSVIVHFSACTACTVYCRYGCSYPLAHDPPRVLGFVSDAWEDMGDVLHNLQLSIPIQHRLCCDFNIKHSRRKGWLVNACILAGQLQNADVCSTCNPY